MQFMRVLQILFSYHKNISFICKFLAAPDGAFAHVGLYRKIERKESLRVRNNHY